MERQVEVKVEPLKEEQRPTGEGQGEGAISDISLIFQYLQTYISSEMI